MYILLLQHYRKSHHHFFEVIIVASIIPPIIGFQHTTRLEKPIKYQTLKKLKKKNILTKIIIKRKQTKPKDNMT